LEANPGSVEAERFKRFAEAGVNRVSLGIQALDDTDLRRLGRKHTLQEALQAVETAQQNFKRVSIDLIYARQNQSLDAWRSELTRALALGTDHLSLYQLTIEDGTVFGEMHAKRLLRGLPSEDLSADMFEVTREICTRGGLRGYEVSNHARVGAESRHNLIYWRMGDYAGIGPGAHGRLTLSGRRFATESERIPAAWLDGVELRGNGEQPRQALSPADRAVEYMMMSLRLDEGASLSRFRALGGEDLPTGALNDLVGDSMIAVSDDRIRATPQGVLMLNGVLRALLAGRASRD
jgi:putative oxygen-independent coproporphyrinogen III oxidase